MADRDGMLRNFLKCTLLEEFSVLDRESLDGVRFSVTTDDPFVEALKKLISSYCNDDVEITIIRNINAEIERKVRSGNVN